MPDLGTAALSSGLSGGFGIIGSLVNYGLQKRLAQQQNQYNIDMWKMQAEYNSPQAQMQRFSEAGLNPNLVYGQGSNGNMSSAPQMVTPQAPELSKEMQELGKAFNIENLRTLIAHRKEAQADARNAEVNAKRNELQLFAERTLGSKYYFDTKTGKFVERPRNSEGQEIIHPSAYYVNDALSRHYLIPYRGALLEQQKNYLVPQVAMARYEQSHQPFSYWIGQGTKVLGSLPSIPKVFSPLQWKFRPGATYNRTNVYY